MDLKVKYDHVTSKDEAYKAVKQAITPELLAKFQVKAELDYQPDLIKAKGKGFELEMFFTPEACEVKINLSFLLKPLKGKVLEGIDKQLKRVV
ncbi:MAG: polyhydroxyalkanoic acid system family protein [Bacteriovoracaceae bacterium]|jgi:hypothetical protein|nr:hypothetical protein [Halobacteriovoraceae bacterium]MDP7320903.1 polyhydroxyalkanoic acid system family protein [Bacteriovoracaceae bacterium]